MTMCGHMYTRYMQSTTYTVPTCTRGYGQYTGYVYPTCNNHTCNNVFFYYLKCTSCINSTLLCNYTAYLLQVTCYTQYQCTCTCTSTHNQKVTFSSQIPCRVCVCVWYPGAQSITYTTPPILQTQLQVVIYCNCKRHTSQFSCGQTPTPRGVYR